MRYGIVADSISIHALREEGDKRELHPRRTSRNFYPRPPRGGRPPATATVTAKAPAFLSTPSARRATTATRGKEGRMIFLSTPSARRATRPAAVTSSLRLNFYPRPPRGGRLLFLLLGNNKQKFLSTPSARRATGQAGPLYSPGGHFYPRPPRGGRRAGRRAR